MKIVVCDMCKLEGKITETLRFLKVKNCPELHIDLCDKHIEEVHKKYPKINSEYVQFCYKLRGVPIDLDMAEKMFTNITKRK